MRRFLSRGLVAGKQYEFVVRMKNGAAEETKVVALSAGEQAKVSFAAAAATKTSLTLRVPADAKVWLAGNATASTGEIRHFETAGLPAGQKDSPANGTSATMSIGVSEPMGGW